MRNPHRKVIREIIDATWEDMRRRKSDEDQCENSPPGPGAATASRADWWWHKILGAKEPGAKEGKRFVFVSTGLCFLAFTFFFTSIFIPDFWQGTFFRTEAIITWAIVTISVAVLLTLLCIFVENDQPETGEERVRRHWETVRQDLTGEQFRREYAGLLIGEESEDNE